jgi:hypothetical protein
VAPTPASVNVIATSVVDPTKQASANVIIVPPVVVGVTPANVSATAGGTQQFAASVTGTSNTAVAWMVSGSGCSGTACGTISSNGLYTAPATVPSPADVTITATSMSNPTQSAQANVTIVPPVGTTYYLATAAAGGNDANAGLTPGAPWLTPNHSVNCGDVIIAAASIAYVSNNFSYGRWGTVRCSAGNNVAWLTCVTFDACKMTANVSSGSGMQVDASYWGVQGWEVSTAASPYTWPACFGISPNYVSPVQIHHIIIANNVANGCVAGGISAGASSTTASVDYLVIVGNIVYNAAQGSASCWSGIDILEPMSSDNLPGTHLYVAGNFSYGNIDGPCNGGAPTDGEGIIFDTFQGTGAAPPYSAQAVADNNILVANGGEGLEVVSNMGSTPAAIYFRHNTTWGNLRNSTESSWPYYAEMGITSTSQARAFENLFSTNSATCCASNPIHAMSVVSSDGTDHVYDNFAYGYSGQHTLIYNSGSLAYGPNNVLGTNPSFANAVAPGAPSCGSYANAPACMATVIANFTPTNAAASGYGYQIPSAARTYDPLFPQWLCNVNLPAGLISMGCQTAP